MQLKKSEGRRANEKLEGPTISVRFSSFSVCFGFRRRHSSMHSTRVLHRNYIAGGYFRYGIEVSLRDAEFTRRTL